MPNFELLSKPELKAKDEEKVFAKLGMFFNKLKFYKGETIIDVGDKINNFYYLQKGVVRLYISNNQGDLMFYDISAGSGFAEPAFFCGLPSKVRVIAVTDSTILSFPKNLVMSYIDQQDEFIKLIVHMISTKIYLVTTLFENMSNNNSWDKLVKVLYLLSSGGKSSKRVINITHEELASMLGIHRVTVTRNLAKLKKDGLITVNRHSIDINDVNKLVSYF
ncbi:Cyclic nucleotide-binding domain-containing protein [Desulfotomaculum arcticum]|uniref:Cyclic nucleotide-binding domain-containing protein n=1 Tax=Desulfotruncus arcticus DSM 17038 TaxID=1121424 RepID=A0A1I2NV85_9FIRM|nr:Crp/Fnr family transcriptional regulator [Desulfotruncus arcticus]SFG07895.1 Cyclic nucleotide-binding domain-containing protein [Desulfotomaculum arcticum] [Desulfotruncus arcticus DSM 17038]